MDYLNDGYIDDGLWWKYGIVGLAAGAGFGALSSNDTTFNPGTTSLEKWWKFRADSKGFITGKPGSIKITQKAGMAGKKYTIPNHFDLTVREKIVTNKIEVPIKEYLKRDASKYQGDLVAEYVIKDKTYDYVLEGNTGSDTNTKVIVDNNVIINKKGNFEENIPPKSGRIEVTLPPDNSGSFLYDIYGGSGTNPVGTFHVTGKKVIRRQKYIRKGFLSLRKFVIKN